MSGREVAGVVIVGGNASRALPQALPVRLCRTAEVTTTGVLINTAGHPQHWGRLLPSGTGTEICLHSITLTGPQRGNTGEGGHPSAHETGGPGPPRPDKKGP